jgi:hypothetical protein
MQQRGAGERPTHMHSPYWPVVSDGIRSLVLILVGWFLIMVLFPAALGAAAR